jgi:hypothetical protein
MFRRECLKLGFCASAAAFLGPAPASASQFVPVPLGDLVRSSQQIWLGVPRESHAEWLETRAGRVIVSHTRVTCDSEVVPGQAHRGELWVRTLGGTIGKVGQLVPGEARLALGERCLVFLAGFVGTHLVTALGLGHYPISAARGRSRLRCSDEISKLGARRGSAVSLLADRELSSALSLIKREAS